MTFASLSYLIFFGIVIILLAISNIIERFYKNISHIQFARHVLLLVASYFFYGWWDWRFCGLMLFVTLVAYIAGRNAQRTWLVRVSVFAVLCVLGVFKYFNFFVDSFCNLFTIHRAGTIQIILPVGISFYTFQAISYMIDVRRKKIESERSFLNVALYISFFPQLVAGPIVKATDFLPQLKENRTVTLKNLEAGIQIFVFGMFKKIVLADNLSVFVDEVYRAPKAFSGLTIFLAAISYAMQIYFDFSGYSDMAIGSAKCLGYDLTKNFNMPYISKNVTEFWKRWHISLSTWLQEYLYIPLGGNRKGYVRTYVNLMLTMLLGGLWHGANWTFVAWGFLHGVALCVHKLFMRYRKKESTSNLIKIISVITTDLFVTFCWIFFRADNFESAFIIIKRIVTWSEGITHIYSWTFVAIILMVICHIYAYHKQKKDNGKIQRVDGCYLIMDLNRVWSLVWLFVAIGMTIGLAYTGSSPFIYFQF